MSPRLKALAVLVVTLSFAASPIFTPAFRGYDPTQFPVAIGRPAILPAGYAFSIWGVIYLWLLAHAVQGVWRRAEDADWDATRPWLFLSLAVGTIWLAVAVRSPVWASVLILIMLAGALAAVLAAPRQRDRWLLSAPLGLYAGWLTAASGVSLGVLLSGYGLLPDQAAAALMLAVVLAGAITVQRRLGPVPSYALVIIWALVAVIVANGAQRPAISGLAAAGILLMAFVGWRAWSTGRTGAGY